MQDLVQEALKAKKTNPRLAASLFEKVIEENGATPFLLSNLGHCLLLANNLSQARSVLEESIRRDPKNVFAFRFLSQVAEKEENNREQIELLSEASSIAPTDISIRVSLLWALIKNKRSKKLILPHTLWLAKNAANNPHVLKAVSVAFRFMGMKDEAYTALKKLLSICPTDGFAMKELLEIGDKDERNKLSEIECLLKLPENKTNRELLFARIKLLENLGETSQAVDAAKNAADLFPDDLRIKSALAQMLVRSSRYKDALLLLHELLKINPGDYYLHNTLLTASDRGNLLNEAYSIYTDLIRIHPTEKRLFGRRRRIQQMLETTKNPPESTENNITHNFVADKELGVALKQHFGFDSFRPGQEEVISAILSGKPILAVMPTGRGKSLCFQLPAVMRGGLTIVVSPLIALMKDQVDDLNKRGFEAAALNSSLTPEEQNAVIQKTMDGKMRFLYIAPERFKSASFMEMLPRFNPQFFVIDEAHCISQWGHDFRPDYLRLGKAISLSQHPQVVAMTATATLNVQRDIVKQLNISNMTTFVSGFERPNLSFAVTQVSSEDEREEKLLDLIKITNGSIIVYTSSRKTTEKIYSLLNNAKITAGVYHAGLEHDERIRVQEGFMQDKIRVIVATNAFGMGIDKPDIRLVLHYQIPGSLESYYQEAGRAGRDGKPARCELLFSYADRRIQEFFIKGSNPTPEVIRNVYKNLLNEQNKIIEISNRSLASKITDASDMMVSSSLNLLERLDIIERQSSGDSLGHVELSGNFLMKPPQESATIRYRLWQWLKVESGNGDRQSFDISPKIIAKELSLNEEQVQRGLRGFMEENLVTYRPPFRGRTIVINKKMNPNEIPIDHEALREKYQRDEEKLDLMIGYGTSPGCRQLRIIQYFGGKSSACGVCDTCKGEKKHKPHEGRKPEKKDHNLFRNNPIFERLRAWRLEKARSEGVPAFCVLSDRTLHSIAGERPASVSELADCFGIGKIKIERYGKELLEIVKDFMNSNG